jgi:hypothetical protein
MTFVYPFDEAEENREVKKGEDKPEARLISSTII